MRRTQIIIRGTLEQLRIRRTYRKIKDKEQSEKDKMIQGMIGRNQRRRKKAVRNINRTQKS